MDKLKELTKDIHLKLPRLMDDGVGQIYERGGDIFKCVLVRTSAVGDTLYYLMDMQDFQTSSYYESEIQTRFQPLGMEPMLNNVLEYLYNLPPMERYNIQFLINFWDLSKPYLKDQSKETIDFLCKYLNLCQN
jgi:hypothetical protein